MSDNRIADRFCPVYGTSVMSQSKDPNNYPNVVALNVHVSNGIDIDNLTLNNFNEMDLLPGYNA